MEQTNSGVSYRQVVAAGATTLGAFALGTALGWSSPVLPELEDETGDLHTTTDQGSWIGSLLSLGALLSTLVAGLMISRFGRRPVMIYIAVPFIAGWLLIFFAVDLAMIYVGRIIVGFSGGVFSLAAPVYIGETASPSIRGLLGSFYQLMLTIGILFSYGVGVPLDWTWFTLICAILPVIMAICIFFMPESPMYLIGIDREEEARKALLFLRAPGYDIDEEIYQTKREIEEIRASNASWRDFKKPSIMKPFLIMLGLMGVQQLSGVNAVIFYTTDIFSAANTGIDSSLQTIIVGILQVVFTAVGALLVDRAGRRLLLLISSCGMAISIFALGAYFYMQDNGDDVRSLGWLPLVSLLVYISIYSIGVGPIPWVVMGELFAPQVKSLAGSFSASFNWLLAFIITVSFTPLVDGIQRGPTFFLFGSILVVGFLFVLIFLPETKGKTLQEIVMYYGGGELVVVVEQNTSELHETAKHM